MTINPLTPVVIGAGHYLHRARDVADGLDPISLMAHASRAAAEDAGLVSMVDVDSIRVVDFLSWRYEDPAAALSAALGIHAPHHAVTTMGGNSPQSLMNTTCEQISAGRLDSALLVGGEAARTRRRARRDSIRLDWGERHGGGHLSDANPDPPEVLGSELQMNLEAETDRGIYLPIQVYPMFETAVRARDGMDPSDHLVRISELWERFSGVAATNPHAWLTDALTAEQIRTPSPDNRMVGTPYTKAMNSNNDVDMAAAVLVCSVAEAERLGVASDRWIFPQSGTDCHEHPFISHRWDFSETPAIAAGGRLALELAGCDIDSVGLIDLYSCFPSAVQLGARSLGLDPYRDSRPLTLTGGLCFAGGPWNNYVMHAIATMVSALREQPGETAMIWANGGYATKHAFGVYRTAPPANGYRTGSPQEQIDHLPSRDLAIGDDASGTATIEAYTVMHDRNAEPTQAIAACLLPDGRRAWGTSDDPVLCTAMTMGEWVGTTAHLDAAGSLSIG
jgi:acetyl-CoA C-acetyltransferase